MRGSGGSSKCVSRPGESVSGSHPVETVVTEHFARINDSLRDALDLVARDPLLKCFAESAESRNYMFDRIEEIFKNTVGAVSAPNLSSAYLNSFELQRTSYEWEKRATDAEKQCEILQEQLKAQTAAATKVLDSRLEAAEEHKQLAELKLVEMEEVLANLRAKISPLESQLNKSQTKNSELEGTLKRQEFAAKEKEEHLIREIKRHADELEIERKRTKELHKQLTAVERGAEVSQGIEGNKILSLEDGLKQQRECIDQLERKLDESEFNRKTLEEHIINLKREIGEGVDLTSTVKKEKHQLELQLIECHNKIGELTVRANFAKEQLEKIQTENDFAKNEIEKLEKVLKADKRKTCNLERELDQVKYSHDLLSKQSSEELKSLREQNTLFKTETKTLHERLESQYKELQAKLDEERKNANKAREKSKILESDNESLKLEVESLQQKVIFYKAQGLGSTQSKQDVAGFGEMEPEYHESRKSRKSDKFESFASFHRNVKEIDVRIKEDHQSGSSLKKETLNVQLATLRMKIVHLKEVFKIENNSIRREVTDLKTLLAHQIETLVAKMRINMRRVRNNSPGNSKTVGKSYSNMPIFERENLREISNNQMHSYGGIQRPYYEEKSNYRSALQEHSPSYEQYQRPTGLIGPDYFENRMKSSYSGFPETPSTRFVHTPMRNSSNPNYSPSRPGASGTNKVRIMRDTTTYHFDDPQPTYTDRTPLRNRRDGSPSSLQPYNKPGREPDFGVLQTPEITRHHIQTSESRLDQLERNLLTKLRRDPRSGMADPMRKNDRSTTPTRQSSNLPRWN